MVDGPQIGKILAVDDELLMREVIGDQLYFLGAEYDLAESAETATELLRAGGYLGVITDGLEGRWRDVVSAAKDAGAYAVLLSGDQRHVDAAVELGVDAHNKNMMGSGFFEKILETMRKPKERKSTVDLAFPNSNEIVDELERLTAGYEDGSEDGIATEVFKSMSERHLDAVHKFAVNGPSLSLMHLKVITDLVNGYDARDPKRTAQEALEMVLAEIDSSRAYFEAILEHDKIPALATLRPKDMPESDATITVWGVRDTAGEEKAIAKRFLPEFDIVERFVRDPIMGKSEYDGSGFTLIGGSYAIIDRNNLL